MFRVNDTERRIVFQRTPLFLFTLASLVPLSGLIDFDTHYLHTVALVIIYSSICLVSFFLRMIKASSTKSELYVYSVMLICTFAITTIYLQDRYKKGIDSKQDFVTNMILKL